MDDLPVYAKAVVAVAVELHPGTGRRPWLELQVSVEKRVEKERNKGEIKWLDESLPRVDAEIALAKLLQGR